MEMVESLLNNTNSSSSNERHVQDTVTNKASYLSQKIHKSALDVSTGQQLSESMRLFAECNSESNISSSSRRHSTDGSSVDGDETYCFKSEANSTHTLMNGKNVELSIIPLPRLDKTTTIVTDDTD